MNPLKFLSKRFSIILIVLVLMMGACNSTPTTGPTPISSAAPPDDVVKAFYTMLFFGGDASMYICQNAGVDPNSLQTAYKRMVAPPANGQADICDLTYTLSDITLTTANVTVTGVVYVEIDGVKSDIPTPEIRYPFLKESGSWKICG